MSVREVILSRAPRPADDIDPPSSQDIAAYVRGHRFATPVSVDDFRVLSYALYHGAIDDADVAAYAGGLEEALRATLRSLNSVGAADPNMIARQWSGFAPLRGFAIHDGTGRSAWAHAGLDLVAAVEPSLLLNIIGTSDDPARFIDAYAFSGYLPDHVRDQLPGVMLATDCDVTVLCAAELLWDRVKQWMTWRAAIVPPELTIITLTPHADNAIVAFAVILDRFASFISRGFGDVQIAQKAAAAAQMLSSIGVQVLRAPMNVKTVARQAGRRSLQVLALLAFFADNAPVRRQAADEIARLGFDDFKAAFESSIDRGPGGDGEPRVFPTMIGPLVEVLKSGMSADIFTDTMDGLMAGRFEMMTNYEIWLRDRPRSVALVLVGALVAQRTGDADLKSAVLDAARWVKSQPGHSSGLGEFDTTAASAFLGVEIPSN